MIDDRVAWLAERRRGLGASDIAAILGVSPWASPWSVWVDKTGLYVDEDEPADHLQFGLDLEPTIASWFERRRPGLFVTSRQRLVAHPEIPWALATLDGLVVDGGDACWLEYRLDDALAVFESKYSADARWDEVPEHYRIQCLWQLLVTGLDVAYLAVMHLAFGRPRFEVYEVARDQAAIDRMLVAAERFWMGHVVAGIPPATDSHPATTSALARYWTDPVALPIVDLSPHFDDVERFAKLRTERSEHEGKVRRLTEQLVPIENRLRAALEDHSEGCIDGQVVVSWRQQDRHGLDTAALRADHPDLAEKYVRVTQQRVLRLHLPRTKR